MADSNIAEKMAAQADVPADVPVDVPADASAGAGRNDPITEIEAAQKAGSGDAGLGGQAADSQVLHLPDGALYNDRLAALQEAIAAKRNPFLSAASVLLQALAEMPQALSDAGAQSFLGMLNTEVNTFTFLCDQTNLRRDHMLAVRFALCTALDELASQTKWGGGSGAQTGMWGTQPLLISFHQETEGGEKVFLLIGRLAASPQEHMNVLEVMLHILGLGFMGSYRTKSDGHRMLETIRHRLYTTVSASREPTPRELSQNWRGVGAGKFKMLRSLPVWFSASFAALVLLLLFGWHKFHLVRSTGQVETRIQEIIKFKAVKKSLTLADVLAPEIKTGQLSVSEMGSASVVHVRGDDMFIAGQSQINPRISALMTKLANSIGDVAGHVTVTGHTDNQPIQTPEFPSNQVLSLKRAQAVATALQAQGVLANRLTTVGAGDSQPISENNSPAGRAKNRRVEIVVGELVKL